MENCCLGVTKKNISNEFCSQNVERSLKIVHVWQRFATPNVTRMEPCQKTLAKVQQIDMVDQHNGSHGCNGRFDAWCSGSRTAIASLASLLLP